MSGSTLRAEHADSDAQDPRVQRSQAALRAAFNRLFLAHGYDPITPAQIAAEAGVGRSTFYDHYAGKAALFRHSVAVVIQPLADAAVGRDCPSLVWVMHHFWENRRFARRVIGGRPAIIIRNQLAELIENALRSEKIVAPIPLPVFATGLAACQLAMLELWLTGRHACTAEQVADALAADGKRLRATSWTSGLS